MDVFVYGTLTRPQTAASFLDEFEYRGPAELTGLHRVDGQYPTLAPGGTTDGRLLRTSEIDALDRYEGVEAGLYVRCSLPFEGSGESGTVECYLGDPAALGAQAEFPGDGTFAERARTYCRNQRVAVRRE